MKHKCDNCDYKYISSASIGACLHFNNLKEAQEAYNADKCPFATPKLTNFDRIKAMSIEDMAKIIQCPKGKNSDYGKRNCKINIPCYSCKKQYLESEVEEE